MFKDAVLLFHNMKRKHIPSSSITFQQLAIAAAKSDLHISTILADLEKVLVVLNKRERDVEQSGPIYNLIIRGYGSIGKFEDALRVFNSLDQSNALCLSAILFVCSTTTPARWNDALMIIHTSDIVVGAQGPGNVESMALSYAIIACSKENEWQVSYFLSFLSRLCVKFFKNNYLLFCICKFSQRKQISCLNCMV